MNGVEKCQGGHEQQRINAYEQVEFWPRWARSAPGAVSRGAEGGMRMEGCAEVAPCIWLKQFGGG